MWGFRQNPLAVSEPVLSVVEGFAVLVSDAIRGFNLARGPAVVTFVFSTYRLILPRSFAAPYNRGVGQVFVSLPASRPQQVGFPLFDNFLFQSTPN